MVSTPEPRSLVTRYGSDTVAGIGRSAETPTGRPFVLVGRAFTPLRPATREGIRMTVGYFMGELPGPPAIGLVYGKHQD
jgi:hypothetical protein